jgi:zinc protease
MWKSAHQKIARGRNLIGFVLGVIAGLVLFTQTASATVFSPETFMLDNGMQVVVVSNPRVPVVTHMVWYKVGAADEGPGESGVAHFLEHLMFKGTPSYPNGEFSKILARNGGQENAFTSYDYTGYFQTVARDRLELVMGMEADRMTNLVLSSEDIDTERLVVLEERRSRTDNNPSALLREQVNAALFLNHPYRRPIIGWEHEIQQLDQDAIIGFYRRWYAPNNAILIVAGDISAAELQPLAEQYYGTIPVAATPARARPTEPPHRAERYVTYRDARVRQPSWQQVYLAPSYVTGDTSQAYPLEILADVLGGGATSRLYRSLVIEQKLAISAGAYYDPGNLGPGRFSVYASPQPGVEFATLIAAVEAEVSKVIDQGISEDELSRSVRSMMASAIYARDSLSTAPRVLGAALTSGQTIEDVESWPDRIAQVALADVQKAAGFVFNKNNSVSAKLLSSELPNE